MAAILNLAILDSAILVFPLKLTHTCQDWFPPFSKKKNFTHSSLFTICTKYFTHSIWLTWWWQPCWILQSWIQPFWTKLWLKLIQSDSNSFILTQLDDGNLAILDSAILSFLTRLDDGSHLEFCQLEFHHLGFSHLSIFSNSLTLAKTLTQTICTSDFKLIHSHSTLWWQPSWILPSGFSHHKTLTQTNSMWLKLIHSYLTWWWQPPWILPSCVQPFCTKKLHSFILTQLDDGGHLEFCHLAFNHFAQRKLHSFILTQIDDGSHLQFCHLEFSHLSFSSQTHLAKIGSHNFQKKKNLTLTWIPSSAILNKILHWLNLINLMMAAILNLGHLGFSHFAQKNFSHSFWLNLMMAAILNLTTWVPPSWIQPS